MSDHKRRFTIKRADKPNLLKRLSFDCDKEVYDVIEKAKEILKISSDEETTVITDDKTTLLEKDFELRIGDISWKSFILTPSSGGDGNNSEVYLKLLAQIRYLINIVKEKLMKIKQVEVSLNDGEVSMDDPENEARLIENNWINKDYFPEDTEVSKALTLGK